MTTKPITAFVMALVLSLGSCKTVQHPEPANNRVELTAQNLSRLDGEYAVFSGKPYNATLDLALTFNKYWWRDVARRKSYSLVLHAINEHRLQVNVMRSDTLRATKIVKYRLKNGDLYIKKTKFDFYFVLNLFGRMHSRISLLESGNLLVDHHNFQFAALVFLPLTGDHVNCDSMEFRRLPAKP